jgi:hypothetical protein
MSTKAVRLKDLLVEGIQTAIPAEGQRLATREDVLAAVRELGGIEVWWCAVLPPDGGASALWGCRQRIAPSVHHDCGPRLIVPLDTGDTE